MIWVAAGLGVLVVFVTAIGVGSAIDPRIVARIVRWIGVGLLGLCGLFLLSRDAFVPAFVILGTAATWAGWGNQPFSGSHKGGSTARSSGRSTIETTWLRMSLDLETGDADGDVLQGAFKGEALSNLDQHALRRLFQEVRSSDLESARLLEAYILRRFPDMTLDSGCDPDRGTPGRVDRAEALEILGLREGASADEVRAAYKALMVKLHPDRGGTDYLAAKINAARDVLLGEAQVS